MDLSQLPQPKDLADLREEARRQVAAQKQSADRFNEFNRMVQEDERFIESRIAAGDAKRKAKT
jgi:hypothetical protein